MKEKPFNIFLRYLFLIIIALPNLFLFYLVFTPLTFYLSFQIIDSVYGANIFNNQIISSSCEFANSTNLGFISKMACINTTIFFKGHFAKITSACIAGSAYYLLLILNLTTPMKQKTRAKSILFIFSSFLIINILRIVFFSILFVEKGILLFDKAHLFTWYFGSTLMLAGIWFANIKLFKIKEIPVYSDIMFLIKKIRHKK
jgi:hypothetical protein